MAERSGRRHTHLRHCLLLRHGRLTFLIGPIAANRSGPKPLAIHGGNGSRSFRLLTECNEAISARTPSLHVPHDTCFRHITERRKGLIQHVVVDLVGQVAHEYVVMVSGVLLRRVVRLIGPVDTNFLPHVNRMVAMEDFRF